MHDVTAKVLSAVHRVALRATAGRAGRTLPGVGAPMLVLETIGRRSGERHAVPLLYLDHDTGYAVIASWGGRDYHPDWYHNLCAAPPAVVEVDGSRIPVRARTCTDPERAVLWNRALQAYPGYADYQARTSRLIPVVALDRA